MDDGFSVIRGQEGFFRAGSMRPCMELWVLVVRLSSKETPIFFVDSDGEI